MKEGDIEIFNDDAKIEKRVNTKSEKVIESAIMIIVFVLLVPFSLGSGMAFFPSLLSMLPAVYFFFLLYFIVVSVKYSREKRDAGMLHNVIIYLLLLPLLIYSLRILSYLF